MMMFWAVVADRSRKEMKKVCRDLNIGDLYQGNTSLKIKRHNIIKKSVTTFEL